MKNKKTTYFLVLVVIAVWGSIIYKIFNRFKSNDYIPITDSVASNNEVFDDYSFVTDTTKLQLNYADPFGLTVDTASAPSKHTVRANHLPLLSVIVKPKINFDFIKYSGFILGRNTKNNISILIINGQETMMTDGETVQNVKLIKNFRDSVKVSYKGIAKYITIKSAAP